MRNARSTFQVFAWMVVPAGALAAACGPSAPQLPPEPDMSALVNAYANPTGTIDPNQVDQIVSSAKTQVDQEQPGWLVNLVSLALVSLHNRLNDGRMPTDPAAEPDSHRLQIEAVATLTRICSGWDPTQTTPDAAQNGDIVATAVVENGQLRRTMTGEASNCQARLQPSSTVPVGINGFLDGTMNVYLYAGLPTTLDEVHVLVQVSGQIGVANDVKTGELDFVINFPEVQYSLSRPDGNLILSIGGPNGITLRGVNGTYTCDPAGGSCVFSGA
jgi:hypothetical protein